MNTINNLNEQSQAGFSKRKITLAIKHYISIPFISQIVSRNQFPVLKSLLSVIFCLFYVSMIHGQQDSVSSGAKKDTTRIILGKKEIKIIETDEGTDITVRNKDEKKDTEKVSDNGDNVKNWIGSKRKRKDGGFRGHWDGVEFGYNAFLNSKHQMSLSGASDKFMSLNSSPMRSSNFNINFCQVNQGIIGNRLGLVTGLRFEFNNYSFDNNNTIADSSGVIVPVYFDPIHLDKSKLTLLYFTIPLMFEFQFPNGLKLHKRMWLAAGITGSLKISSHTKVVYRENGNKQKDKNKDDFNIYALRYGLTARAGYSDFFVYGNYYPVAFFEKDKGPVIYPFSVGIGFHFD